MTARRPAHEVELRFVLPTNNAERRGADRSRPDRDLRDHRRARRADAAEPRSADTKAARRDDCGADRRRRGEAGRGRRPTSVQRPGEPVVVRREADGRQADASSSVAELRSCRRTTSAQLRRMPAGGREPPIRRPPTARSRRAYPVARLRGPRRSRVRTAWAAGARVCGAAAVDACGAARRLERAVRRSARSLIDVDAAGRGRAEVPPPLSPSTCIGGDAGDAAQPDAARRVAFEHARSSSSAREQCFGVRTRSDRADVTLESDASEPTCVTPRDTFPPAAPKGLQVVAEAGAINLIWDAEQRSGSRRLPGLARRSAG